MKEAGNVWGKKAGRKVGSGLSTTGSWSRWSEGPLPLPQASVFIHFRATTGSALKEARPCPGWHTSPAVNGVFLK